MKLIVKENYNSKSTSKLKNENISVAYDKPNGKTGRFLLDFSDTRSLFRELEDVAGYDFSHQVEQEFYSWKEGLAYIATGLKEDCQDISDTISDIRKSVDDLYESGKANEVRSELFYILEQLDELKKMVKDTSIWSNELTYTLTGTGLDD